MTRRMIRREKIFRRWALPLFLSLCAPLVAFAQENGNPANWCRNGAFPSDSAEFNLARAVGEKNSRVYFYGDDEGCPAPTEKCRQKAYVIPGDTLIVAHTFGDFVCAWYQPAKGHETVGWIQSGQLVTLPSGELTPPASWIGEWEFYGDTLNIKRGAKANLLHVEGEAFWHGVNPENVHTGEVSGEAAPAGFSLAIVDDPCKLTLRLVGEFLIASDNGDCGGANVRFDGVYRKKK